MIFTAEICHANRAARIVQHEERKKQKAAEAVAAEIAAVERAKAEAAAAEVAKAEAEAAELAKTEAEKAESQAEAAAVHSGEAGPITSDQDNYFYKVRSIQTEGYRMDRFELTNLSDCI